MYSYESTSVRTSVGRGTGGGSDGRVQKADGSGHISSSKPRPDALVKPPLIAGGLCPRLLTISQHTNATAGLLTRTPSRLRGTDQRALLAAVRGGLGSSPRTFYTRELPKIRHTCLSSHLALFLI